MGVLGLWKLVDATGKPVPLETLEGKVLAIDVSIWIHQVIQGYQDRRGNALPNAHLIGLFNRICKLMYFKIKPVFVFDGGVPLLKKNTIATRRKLKSIAASKAQKLKNDLINNLIKHSAVKGALDKGNDEGESSATQGFKDSSAIADTSSILDMYKLPDIPSTSKLDNPEDYIDSDEEYQKELSPRKQTKWMGNIHSVDVNNEEFKNLPADVRYDILTDLKETRKQNSWGRIHELPAGSNNYSGFQVTRLLKRRYVQESLEVAEKEMGGKTLTLEELDRLLTDQGIQTTQNDAAFRIASDSSSRVIYVKENTASQNSNNSKDSQNPDSNKPKEQTSNSLDAYSDSVSVNSDTSVAVIDNIKAYDLDEDWSSDGDFTITETTLNDSQVLPKSEIPKSVMNPALAYMIENSGFTRDQILKIVEQTKKNKKKSDAASSNGSSIRGKRTPRRLSAIKNRKRRKLFESTITDVPKIKKEIVNDEEVINLAGSNSESDEFVEVPEKANIKNEQIENKDQTITMESSDSGTDDFVEIQDVPIPELLNNKKTKSDGFQITIKADENVVDDIFADVFTDLNEVKKSGANVIRKPSLDTIQEKDFLDNKLFTTSKIKEEPVEVKEEIDKTIKKTENYENYSTCFSVENSQTEFSNIALPVTPKKINSTSETNSILSNSGNFEKTIASNSETNNILSNLENSEKTIHSKAITSDTEMNENSDIVEDNDIEDEENADLIINNETTLNSETSKDDSNKTTQNNSDIIQEKSNEKIVEVEKQPPMVFPVNEEELESMKKQLEVEQQQITGTLGKLERQATDITDQMRSEAQELLRLFGVPYIVAPMEAEAQCAYLEQFELTDGTITDDSDVWLFGGRCVYKNFFDNNKKVLQFLSKDIEHHFKLSRKEMILLALLVGSDYTTGLTGVGPVTALEILASFPTQGEDILRGLRSFCTWFRAGKLAAPGKSTLRNKLKNVQIEKGFPSQAVVQAYMCPMVDESKEAFTWSKPNLVLLADYVKKKFGWTKLKFEEIINPVMKRLTEAKSQKGINSYFKVSSVPKSIEAVLSKRVQTAVQKLSGKNQDGELLNDEIPTSNTKEKIKRVRKTTGKKGKRNKDDSNELAPIVEASQDEPSELLTTPKTNESECAAEMTEEDKILKEAISRVKRRKVIDISEEVIPQREKDKANALNSKLKAIEIFRKSKKGLNRTNKISKVVKKIKEDAELSESSDSS